MNNRNLIRFDWAIKRLLRNKADFLVLEGFLSELLKDDIIIQSILESESNQKIDSDKFNRVDMLVKNSKDELFLVIHSGSRNIGGQVAKYYQNIAINNLTDNSKEREELIARLKKEGEEKYSIFRFRTR